MTMKKCAKLDRLVNGPEMTRRGCCHDLSAAINSLLIINDESKMSKQRWKRKNLLVAHVSIILIEIIIHWDSCFRPWTLNDLTSCWTLQFVFKIAPDSKDVASDVADKKQVGRVGVFWKISFKFVNTSRTLKISWHLKHLQVSVDKNQLICERLNKLKIYFQYCDSPCHSDRSKPLQISYWCC